jgi:hypothetical protein
LINQVRLLTQLPYQPLARWGHRSCATVWRPRAAGAFGQPGTTANRFEVIESLSSFFGQRAVSFIGGLLAKDLCWDDTRGFGRCLLSLRHSNFPHVIPCAGTQQLVQPRAKTLPFPQHHRETAFAKGGANFDHRASRDRNRYTRTIRQGGYRLEESQVHTQPNARA